MIPLQCCVSAVHLNQFSVYIYPLPLEPPSHPNQPLGGHQRRLLLFPKPLDSQLPTFDSSTYCRLTFAVVVKHLLAFPLDRASVLLHPWGTDGDSFIFVLPPHEAQKQTPGRSSTELGDHKAWLTALLLGSPSPAPMEQLQWEPWCLILFSVVQILLTHLLILYIWTFKNYYLERLTCGPSFFSLGSLFCGD